MKTVQNEKLTWILKLKQCLQVIVVKIINLDNSAMVRTFSFACYIGAYVGLLQFCTKTNLQKLSCWDNWWFLNWW